MKLTLFLENYEVPGTIERVKIEDLFSMTSEKDRLFVSAKGGVSRMFALKDIANIRLVILDE